MNTHADKTQENKSQAVANSLPKQPCNGEPVIPVAQRRLPVAVNNNPEAGKLSAFRATANENLPVPQLSTYEPIADRFIPQTSRQKENAEAETPQGRFEPFQKKTIVTGIPGKLKSNAINIPRIHQRKISVTTEQLEYDNAEIAYNALKSTFRDIPEVSLKTILSKLNKEDARFHDFRNLKYHIEQLAAGSEEQDLSASPDLWMKAGGLDELRERMDGQVELWPELSKDLVEYCTLKPEEVKKAGDILDCGKLTLPPDLNITPGNFTKGLAEVPDELRMRLGAFLLGFMKANGQLAYIQSKEWFRKGTHKVVIEINFYPARDFDEKTNTLGVHKDTDSRNLFVNLIFNNPTKMPGTEWTMDELPPDETRMRELAERLPQEEMINIMAAKEKMKGLPQETPGRSNWEGGTVEPNSYVSWVDELIWHSTPAMGKRPRFDVSWILNWFENGCTENYMTWFYDAMLVVSENTHGKIINNLEFLKTALRDQSTWMTTANELRTNGDAEWIGAYNEILNEIQAIDWASHKMTGRAGRVEVDIGKGAITDNRTVPTGAGGRPRSNSVDNDVIAKNQEALLEMRGGVPEAELPKRSFIRTWVTLVKNI